VLPLHRDVDGNHSPCISPDGRGPHASTADELFLRAVQKREYIYFASEAVTTKWGIFVSSLHCFLDSDRWCQLLVLGPFHPSFRRLFVDWVYSSYSTCISS
jgi:hypothetical protein